MSRLFPADLLTVSILAVPTTKYEDLLKMFVLAVATAKGSSKYFLKQHKIISAF